MSGRNACINPKEHRNKWGVMQRHYQASAFNGYRIQRTDRSTVYCPVCRHVWRTAAAYVETLPDWVEALQEDNNA